MKLLIVDDQQATLRGLAGNIPWQDVGFDEVNTAGNAMEARLCFGRGVPDVMLCDIEMPVETGIDLCQWVRHKGYGTKIIFLTCHSDFQYAKQAIELKASDYIVQPAPYEEIRAKVESVVKGLCAEAKNRRWQAIGKNYATRQKEIGSSLWRGFLLGTVSARGFDSLPSLPDIEEEGWLALLQVVRWTASARRWQEDQLAQALQNFAEDIFGPVASCVLTAYMERNTYTILVQGVRGDEQPDISGRLRYLSDAYEMYMPCKIALYPVGPCPVTEMPGEWKRLLERRDRNVAGKKGVIGAPAAAAVREEGYQPQAMRWLQLLKEQGAAVVEEDACACLDRLLEEGRLTAGMMASFCMDFNHLLARIWEPEGELAVLQRSADWQTMSHEAMHSADRMRELIHETMGCCGKQEADSGDEQNVTKQIVDYIQENIWGEIRKEDITELVHLNGDYVTRLFKKEMGISVKGYIIRQKLLEARKLLRTTSLSVSSVAVQLGYGNFSHFSAAYKKEFGITPAEERSGRGRPQEEKTETKL
ncbi:MAG: response regulator [Lachnospiraceae bacterium]|jgi:two-component system response regulator YesN|nr:response regulator [Lachnospiraceae bacterium]